MNVTHLVQICSFFSSICQIGSACHAALGLKAKYQASHGILIRLILLLRLLVHGWKS